MEPEGDRVRSTTQGAAALGDCEPLPAGDGSRSTGWPGCPKASGQCDPPAKQPFAGIGGGRAHLSSCSLPLQAREVALHGNGTAVTNQPQFSGNDGDRLPSVKQHRNTERLAALEALTIDFDGKQVPTADFGAPQSSLSLRIHQLSATRGRGTPRTAQL